MKVSLTVQAMLARAGFYLVSGDGFTNSYYVVEVEPDGTCHQLSRSLQRDGVLAADGWPPQTCVKGPFVDAFTADLTQRADWYGSIYTTH